MELEGGNRELKHHWMALLLMSCLVVACSGDAPGVCPDCEDGCEEGWAPIAGECECTGCVVDEECLPGRTVDACGEGGVECFACSGDEHCVEGICQEAPDCSPLTCDGCCEGDECLDGDEGVACGSGGSPCMRCAADGDCDLVESSRQCVQACDATNCDGCCRPNGDCVVVPSASYCGQEGEACVACGEGEECDSGQCIPSDCASTCDGCCDSDGNCIKQFGSPLCGWGGSPCVECEAGTYCSKGQCITTSCRDTCDGCCIGGECFPGTSENACGSRGYGCFDCTRFDALSCTMWVDDDRYCYDSPHSEWRVAAVDAEAQPTDAEGNSWDPWGGLPDLYLRFIGFYTAAYESKSSVFDNTLTADWGEEYFTDPFPLGGLVGLFSPGVMAYDIYLMDRDLLFDVEMDRCFVWRNIGEGPTKLNKMLSGETLECSRPVEEGGNGSVFRYRFQRQ